MKKISFALILCLCAGLSACASSQPAQGVATTSQMTQPIVTGNGLKDVQNGIKAAGEPLSVPPSMDALLSAFHQAGIAP